MDRQLITGDELLLRLQQECLDAGIALPDDRPPPLDREALFLPLTQIRAVREPWRWNMASGPGVYFLFQRLALVYVGRALNLGSRLNTHGLASIGQGCGKPIPFNKVATLAVHPHWLDQVERHYIRTLRPPFNVKGVPR